MCCASETIPAGVLHPRRIMDGVIAGIEDYGNKMGIPTVNGATLFHPGYTSNPLVFCGCLGILPHGSHVTGAKPGDLIVVLGGRTGRDGLRGATFSSMEMDTTTSEIAGSAVQIGHPIHEKQVLEVVLRARDARLYTAITDCGAGGLSSAVGEMPAELGAQVQLADVPLKYAGLRPWEIWLSEAQERMVLAIPPDNWGAFAAICEGQSIEAVCIGTFEQTGRLVLHYGEKCVGDLDLHFLHDGIPQRHLRAEWSPTPESPKPTITDIHGELLRLLADPNIRSKEKIVRLYDHEVQGGTAIKPLVGNGGHSDAAVIVPLDTVTIGAGEVRGIVLSNGIAPHVADPYDMAFAAIDEAMRNLVAVGGDPDQVAILDNFCWGNPTLPDRLGTLVRCAQGCHDAAIAYGVPFISGKDSLNNEYADENGTRHAIPGTLLISAVSIVPDVNKTVTSNLKRAGNALYVVNGESAPLDTMRALHRAIRAGLVEACHDVSEGGIAVAIAEMCIAGGIGAAIDIEHIGIDSDPFVEGLTRFVVEVAPDNIQAFEAMLPCTRIGVVGGDHLSIGSVQWHIADIDRVWRGEDPRQRNVSVRAQKPFQRPARVHTRTTPPRALILHATGTNRDRDAALACRLAGAEPEIVHVNQLASGERKLGDYQIMIVPGGFSYGDDLGAGKLWALDLINSNTHFGKDVEYFISDGRPVLGICNGFQALVKAGLLPGGEHAAERSVTLTFNKSKHFECRWTFLSVVNSVSLFTDGITDGIYCPVAHGEGRFIANDEETLQSLWDNGMVALTYLDTAYPGNPNGSQHSIAGICNAAGNVLGLMPHPENHIFPWQHPAHDADDSAQTSGLRLFKNAVKYA
jgi:phosphoribosylformylglycinamidine synthase I